MTLDEARWAQPQEVRDLDLAFPAEVEHLMPAREDLPEEFRSRQNAWVRFQNHWFFHGLGQSDFYLRSGVDGNAALRHLRCIQGSFAPKHEHKEAAVAYLCSRWFIAIVLEDGTIFADDPEAVREALANP